MRCIDLQGYSSISLVYCADFLPWEKISIRSIICECFFFFLPAHSRTPHVADLINDTRNNYECNFVWFFRHFTRTCPPTPALLCAQAMHTHRTRALVAWQPSGMYTAHTSSTQGAHQEIFFLIFVGWRIPDWPRDIIFEWPLSRYIWIPALEILCLNSCSWDIIFEFLLSKYYIWIPALEIFLRVPDFVLFRSGTSHNVNLNTWYFTPTGVWLGTDNIIV